MTKLRRTEKKICVEKNILLVYIYTWIDISSIASASSLCPLRYFNTNL